jgi:peptide/nickel transport system substrate-binding protein
MSVKVVWIGFLTLSLALVLACGGSAPAEPVIVEKEVVKEVTKEVVVEKEVTKEVVVIATPVPPIQSVVRAGDPTGTLTVSLENLGAQTTDPILQGRAGHAQYQAPIYDALLGFNLESQYGGVGPGVAEEWGIDPDGNSWTFRLQEGLVFHNGEALTAEDVKFSLERTMFHEESLVGDGNRLSRQLRQPPEEAIEVIDPLTVRMHTDGPKPHFWSLLTRAVFQGGQIMPKDYIESVGDDGFRAEPVGSGPWMYAGHSVGDYFQYEAFDKSHRGIPHFAKMSLLIVPEESTKLAMVRTGQADIIDLVPESAPEVDAAGAKLTVVEGVGMFIYQFWGLYFDEAQALPISDVRVRQAMSLAINRQDIIDYSLNGFGRPSMPFATFPTSVDVDVPRWQKWSEETLVYDPERARQLLAEAGYPDGFEVTFWSTNFSGTPYMNDLSQAVTGFWEEIGIETDLRIIEGGVFTPMTRVPGHDEWGEGFNGDVSIFRNAGRPLPVPRYQTTFHPESIHYAFGDREHMTPLAEEYLRLHEIAASERDEAKRFEATNDIIQLVADQWIGVPIVQGVSLYASNPDTVGRWQGIYGRGELGDVFHRIPHAEGNPWP